MKISEIAKLHDRTYGAIRARLKKHDLEIPDTSGFTAPDET